MAFLSDLKQSPYELNSSLYLSIFGTIIISIFFVLKLTRRSKFNLPPSPPKLPFIGNLHQLGTLPHRSLRALSNEYGPLMSLQLGQTPALVVSSTDVFKEITKNHDVVFSDRPHITAAKIFLYECMDVAFANYGEEWRNKKKICVLELLSLKRVRSFRSIREEEVAELVDNIRGACASKGSCVNLSEMVTAASNDIVCRCVLGQKYDTPDGSGGFGEVGRQLVRQFGAFSVGDFFPSLGWIDALRGLISEFKSTIVALDAFFDEVIGEHKRRSRSDGESNNKDFVEILLQLQEGGGHDFEPSRDNLKLKALLTVSLSLYFNFLIFF